MLTEEAHHMFVGETGIQRMVQRTAELMHQNPGAEPRKLGVIDLATLQKYLNYWYSISLDLFGGEVSSNAAQYFASGLKGRAHEERFDDHVALSGSYEMDVPKNGVFEREAVPLRNAMNEVLRDAYVEDCQRGVDKWNKTIQEAGVDFRLELPSRRFNRQVGIYGGLFATPDGQLISKADWQARQHEWLPSEDDRAFVASLMTTAVTEPGKMANWIAAPKRGIKGRPVEFEYVRFD
jgi:benzoyl-CoA 2,3-dioxygenase component B